ncbi:MAG: hypothetical protein AAFU64_15650, partial [Bacteroidota bacterium]
MMLLNWDHILLSSSLEKRQLFLHLVFVLFLFSVPIFLFQLPFSSPFIFYKKIFLSLYFPFMYLTNVNIFT